MARPRPGAGEGSGPPADASALAERIAASLASLPDGSTAGIRRDRRRWTAALRAEPGELVFAAALHLLERHGWRWVAYELIAAHPAAFAQVTEQNIERLAGAMRSWGDVDQFGVLLAGRAWRAGLISDQTVLAWTTSPDWSWRRAALVATVPLNVRSQGGQGDVARTLAVCTLLVDDRDDLVVKSLSWALRELVAHDAAAVEAFLAGQGSRLAPRVRREVASKLSVGLKTPRRH